VNTGFQSERVKKYYAQFVPPKEKIAENRVRWIHDPTESDPENEIPVKMDRDHYFWNLLEVVFHVVVM
jgi:hypothetical protein